MTQNLILGAGILTWILLIVVLVLKKEKYEGGGGSCIAYCGGAENTDCITWCRGLPFL